MPTPPREGRGYWWAAVVLFVLAAAGLGFAVIMLFTTAYAFGAGADGDDVDCRASSVSIVWADGSERVPEGYEDACRSSAEDDIWIGGVAAVFAVAFAAGGVLCVRTARMPLLPALAGMSVTGGQALSVPLGHGWGSARAELTSEDLTLVVPSILGRRRWTIPMSDITVVDPDGIWDAMTEDVVPATPLTIPQFYVAPTIRSRQLTLLFSAPRRVPRFRFWAIGTGVSPRETRSAAGVWADGVVLNVRSRPSVVTAFVHAGARAVRSEAAWTRAHRRVVADPVEHRLMLRADKWVSRALFIALVPLGLGVRFLAETNNWVLALLVAIAGLMLAITYLSRLLRRR